MTCGQTSSKTEEKHDKQEQATQLKSATTKLSHNKQEQITSSKTPLRGVTPYPDKVVSESCSETNHKHISNKTISSYTEDSGFDSGRSTPGDLGRQAAWSPVWKDDLSVSLSLSLSLSHNQQAALRKVWPEGSWQLSLSMKDETWPHDPRAARAYFSILYHSIASRLCYIIPDWLY